MDIAQDGNLFPREDILEAVAQSDWRDQPVPAGAWCLTAVGLVVIALGMPVLAPLAMEPTTFAAAEPRPWLNPLHGLAALGGRLGIGIESTWYLISALCLGASLPLLGGALRILGIGPRLALVTGFLTMLSPVVLLHGRLPSDFTAGVLGSCLALAFAFAPSDTGAAGSRGYGVRLGLALLVAVLFHPLNGLLAVPLLFAAKARGGRIALIPVVIASVFACAALPNLTAASAGQVLRGMDFYVGLGPLVLCLPLAWSGAREESPPPFWLTAWLAVGAVASIGTAFEAAGTTGPAAPMLIPVVAALVASTLSRFARPDNTFRAAAAIAAGTAGLIAASPWLSSPTEHRGLAEAAPSLFQPGDVVFVDNESSADSAAYLVRRRFGVPVEVLDAKNDGASQAVGRAIGLAPNVARLPWTLDAETGTIEANE